MTCLLKNGKFLATCVWRKKALINANPQLLQENWIHIFTVVHDKMCLKTVFFCELINQYLSTILSIFKILMYIKKTDYRKGKERF